MNIAIIANDKKKELITEFCMAYCGVLSRHNICATATTAKYIAEATGLSIEKLLSGTHGGAHQLASKIAYGEVDLLILLCDTRNAQEYMEVEVLLTAKARSRRRDAPRSSPRRSVRRDFRSGCFQPLRQANRRCHTARAR